MRNPRTVILSEAKDPTVQGALSPWGPFAPLRGAQDDSDGALCVLGDRLRARDDACDVGIDAGVTGGARDFFLAALLTLRLLLALLVQALPFLLTLVDR